MTVGLGTKQRIETMLKLLSFFLAALIVTLPMSGQTQEPDQKPDQTQTTAKKQQRHKATKQITKGTIGPESQAKTDAINTGTLAEKEGQSNIDEIVERYKQRNSDIMNDRSDFRTVIYYFLAFCFYFVPTYIAKNKRNFRAIFALNLLLGWTVIGWVAALVWALMQEEAPPKTVRG